MVHMLAQKVVAVFEARKVLEDVSSALQEETPDFLNLDVLHEHVFVLKLCPVLGVVAHQELSKEVARVEPFENLFIDVFDCIGLVSPSDSSLIFHLSLVLLGQSLNSGEKHRVQSLCQVDIIVLFLLASNRLYLDGLTLHAQQVLNVPNRVVFAVQFTVIILGLVKPLVLAA